MKKGTVSVIVPVFNTEKYLACCLDSICKQSYADLQIILINDGSTDGSMRICEEYAKKDSRITLLSQKNAGVSSARNAGLGVAVGHYLCFVDSDDYLEIDAINTLVSSQIHEDLIVSRFSTVDENGSIESESKKFDSFTTDSDSMIKYVLNPTIEYEYQGYLWNKLYLNEIIQKNCIRFDESISYNEDRLFLINYLLSSKKVRFISDKTYKYRQRSGSAMGAVEQHFKVNQLTELHAFDEICLLLKKHQNMHYYAAVKEAARCAKMLCIRISRSKTFVAEKKQVKSHVYVNSRIVIFSPIGNVSIKDRCKCLYYCLQVILR